MFTKMNPKKQALLCGVAFLLGNQVAVAQPIEEVVVTGSHIRGVAPVGSSLISVGVDDLQKTGAPIGSDVLLKLAQFSALGFNEESAVGGGRAQAAAGNVAFSRSMNLRGIGRERTLTLFNGQRVTHAGLDNFVDVDIFPSSLISRVEVVADGASATYGSDAVAGTVNVILAEPKDVLETTAQAAFKSGGMDWLASIKLGTTWDRNSSGIGDGGLLIAFQHLYKDPLDAADRPNLFNDDFSPYIGATGLPDTFFSPGNVRGLGPTTGNIYASPAGIGSTQGITLAQLGPANQPNRESRWNRAVALPQEARDTLGGVFKQKLADWLTFSASGYYDKRKGRATISSRVNNSTITVPSTNPYSPCAPAASKVNAAGLTCPANNSITVLYAWADEFQSARRREYAPIQYGGTGAFDVALFYDWHANLSAHYSKAYVYGTEIPTVNTTALTQVVSGTGKPTNVPFFNPFCDNSAAPCNNPITLSYVAGVDPSTNTNWLNEYSATLDGPLFDLPAGTVRLAAGGSWSKNSFLLLNQSGSGAAIGVITATTTAHNHQTTRALFGELYIPLVGEANAMPGVQKLELTLAGRITEYSTFGTTRDPKVGVNWSPLRGLSVHGSWGTSFRAPDLRSGDPFGGAGFNVDNTLKCGSYVGINLAACTAAVPADTVLSGIIVGGGRNGLGPETAKTWSLGADWTPDEIPGLLLSATYYNLDITGAISQAQRDTGLVGAPNSGLYDQYMIYNPTYFPTRAANNPAFEINGVSVPTRTQAEFNAFLIAVRSDLRYVSFTDVTTNPVVVFLDGRTANLGTLQTDGVDFNAQYTFGTDWGTAHVGASGNYTLSYKQSAVPGAPVTSLLNQFNSNIRFRARGEVGLENGPWSGTVYFNYTNPYVADAGFVPPGAGPQYLKIKGQTTVDLSVGYKIEEISRVPFLRDTSLTLSITNVLDTDPPFFLNNGTPRILYDNGVASAVGRLITIRVTKDW